MASSTVKTDTENIHTLGHGIDKEHWLWLVSEPRRKKKSPWKIDALSKKQIELDFAHCEGTLELSEK